jgi:hypothetical protein
MLKYKNFMKIRPMEVELFFSEWRSYGRTDMTKLVVSFRSFCERAIKLQLEHTSGRWRLPTYSSKVSLKTVLLRNGGKFPSVPLADAVHVKATYENLHVLLQESSADWTAR